MTRDEWKELEARLVYQGATEKLRVDDRDITLQVHRDKMRLCICVFVGGEMRGAWLIEDCDERRRFMRPITKCLFKPSPKDIRTLGKRWCEDMRKERTFTYYTPYWPSFKPLGTHLRKNNQSIEWVRGDCHVSA